MLGFEGAVPGLPNGRPDRRIADGTRQRKAGAIINIALVNNMPDKALKATEQQYRRLLRAVSGTAIVRLHCFSLPSVQRSDEARAAMADSYAAVEALDGMRIDGLIATGAEPIAPALSDEPFWPALTRLVDWAERNTIASIWSCLAAHAAVLHLDGIQRRRLPAKCSGVFACEVEVPHWLVRDLPAGAAIPHSRLNALEGGQLSAKGYQVLTRSGEAGVDTFVRSGASEFVFFQGHPEYDPLTLQREFTRDLGRYARGEQASFPATPAHYFDLRTEDRIAVLRARADLRGPGALGKLPAMTLRDPAGAVPRATAECLFRNWVSHIVARRNG